MIENVLNKLHRVKPSGKRKWIACCPAHADKSPSLHIELADNGNVLMTCFSARCDVKDIVRAADIDWRDMFGESGEYTAKKSKLYASEGLKIIRDETRFILKCAYAMRNGTLTNNDLMAIERRMPKLQNVFKDCGL